MPFISMITSPIKADENTTVEIIVTTEDCWEGDYQFVIDLGIYYLRPSDRMQELIFQIFSIILSEYIPPKDKPIFTDYSNLPF